MKKLELKHLAPYLPFQLKVKSINNGGFYTIKGMTSTALQVVESMYGVDYFDVKPILRPLSDLTKKCVINNREFIPLADIFCMHPTASFRFTNYKDMVLNCWDDVSDEYEIHGFYLNPIIGLNKHQDVQKLFEWRFDVFGLITEGLAIDINTLKNQNQDG